MRGYARQVVAAIVVAPILVVVGGAVALACSWMLKVSWQIPGLITVTGSPEGVVFTPQLAGILVVMGVVAVMLAAIPKTQTTEAVRERSF